MNNYRFPLALASRLFLSFAFFFTTICVLSATVVYVDITATGSDNGRSWTNAYTDLQDALDKARNTPSVTEIWVATGTYLPSQNGDRAASFELVPGVAIYGGFKGTESLRSEREPQANQVVLSGNIGDATTDADNSYHVLLARNITDPETTIDGFYIQDGRADGSGLFACGGGFLNYNDNTGGATAYYRISGLVFSGNYAKRGGGMCNYAENDVHDSLIIEQCTFDQNEAIQGGGVANYKSTDSQIECAYQNCAFSRNNASNSGGAAANDGLSGQIISQFKCNVKYIGCTFWNNTARSGGVFYIADNSSKFSVLSRNCSLYGNDASSGSDAVCVGDNGSILMGNIIAWNGSAIRNCSFLIGDNTITVNNSLIENSSQYNDFPSISDPGFVDPANGDLHISACSPLIDEGTNYNLPTPTDLDGNPRMIGNFLDLGAYEFSGDPIGLPIPNQASLQVVATQETTAPDGWTHYYTCDNPERLVLSVFKDGQDVGTLGQDGFVVQTVTLPSFGQAGLNRSSADYLRGMNGWMTFNRYWQVLNAKSVQQDLKVRFYFSDIDFEDIQKALDASGTPRLTDATELRFFTVSGADPLSNNVIGSNGTYTPLEYNTEASTSEWTLGSYDGNTYAEFVVDQLSSGSAGSESLAPLPVEFKSFGATLVDQQKVRLEWVTASEVNNDYFLVERSHNGVDFFPLEVVPGQGNAQVESRYESWDFGPQNGANYYRLKQVDVDGQFSYSAVASVFLEGEDGKALVFPNPTNGPLSIQLPVDLEGQLRMQLFDSYNRLVWEEILTNFSAARMSRNFEHLQAGMYVLKLNAKRYRSFHPLVITQLD
ncbi:MAG: choice-of-anchor Q domain-containing protein [Bacteroidota bacterium]